MVYAPSFPLLVFLSLAFPLLLFLSLAFSLLVFFSSAFPLLLFLSLAFSLLLFLSLWASHDGRCSVFRAKRNCDVLIGWSYCGDRQWQTASTLQQATEYSNMAPFTFTICNSKTKIAFTHNRHKQCVAIDYASCWFFASTHVTPQLTTPRHIGRCVPVSSLVGGFSICLSELD